METTLPLPSPAPAPLLAQLPLETNEPVVKELLKFQYLKLFKTIYSPDLTYDIVYHIEANRDVDPKVVFDLVRKTFCDYALLTFGGALHRLKDVVEIGPIPNFETPWGSNVMSILRNCGVTCINKMEQCRRYLSRDLDKVPYDPILEQIYPNEYTFQTLGEIKDQNYKVPLNDISKFSSDFGLTFDEAEIEYYKSNLFKTRDPTNVELFDLGQSNSEHSRHWFFNGKLNNIPKSLFKTIKEPWQMNPNNSVIAFCDDASAIKPVNSKGTIIMTVVPETKDLLPKEATTFCQGRLLYSTIPGVLLYPTLTAETHNFPTTFAPFPGANTGVGGCLRDSQSVGRGGQLCAATAGYSVSDMKTLIEASNGASDYGNKIGEPVIQGFSRYFPVQTVKINKDTPEQDYGYYKCIMFCGALGQILGKENTIKQPPKAGMHIVRIGGPAYRIGLGGGTASSRSETLKVDVSAIQRGDPEMENKMNRVLRRCYENQKGNIIQSIHDQGAGGMANVTKEIVSPIGASVYLDRVPLGDTTMTDLEIWCAEYQEQVTALVNAEDVDTLQGYCESERVPFCDVGIVEETGRIVVFSHSEQSQTDSNPPIVVDLDLAATLENIPRKNFTIQPMEKLDYIPLQCPLPPARVLQTLFDNVIRNPTVGSKRFLTSKVDRSVTGLIAQQQCVGPNHTPLADVCVIANSYFDTTGIASAIGEQPIKSLFSVETMVQLSIAEMLTNLMWANITSFEDIKCSGNWMWPLKRGNTYDSKEGHQLYLGVQEASRVLKVLGIAIDGGKDSLSMIRDNVKSPETFVVSGYVGCKDITKTVTPDLKRVGNSLYWIPLGTKCFGLGGTIFAETTNQLTHDFAPDIKNWYNVRGVFEWIQEGISNGYIASGHDISDGGLITTVLEMAIGSSKYGVTLQMENIMETRDSDEMVYRVLFSEEPGIVIECNSSDDGVVFWLDSLNVKFCKTEQELLYIGDVTKEYRYLIQWNDTNRILDSTIGYLITQWEDSSYKCDLMQSKNADGVFREYDSLYNPNTVTWRYPTTKNPTQQINASTTTVNIATDSTKQQLIKVGIIREEGSNGDREMAAAFLMAGFQCVDISMYDLQQNPKLLQGLNGIAFVGGFSYSDCLGAGQGWCSVIQNNPDVYAAFEEFRTRPDTFSLGVCNGCQMLSLLGWVGDCKFVQNESGKFESRFPTVKICESPAIMFKGLSGAVLGVWCAHGEGQLRITGVTKTIIPALQFVNADFDPTVAYPNNPNGSVMGITAVCSSDGRHLAMMPHPERSFIKWQLPWEADSSRGDKITRGVDSVSDSTKTLWFDMFVNARKWVESQK